KGKRLELLTGKLEATVARQSLFRPMKVTTPQAEARVLGTRFSLIVADNASRLDVTAGQVRFTRLSDGRSVKVGGNSHSIATANSDLTVLPSTGGILREAWTNVPGTYHASYLRLHPKYPNNPDISQTLKTFEGPVNAGENYGARYRGFLHPPVTGQ